MTLSQSSDQVSERTDEPIDWQGRDHPSKSRFKWLIVLPLVLLPVGWSLLLTAKRGDKTAEIAGAHILPVETMRLEAATSYAVTREYTGEIVAHRTSDLGFERAGTVMAVLVDDGDLVAAGEPLARLDMRDLDVQRQQLEAQKRQAIAQLQELETGPRRENLAAAEAAVSDLANQLKLAQLQANRRAELFGKGAISQEELDEKHFGANAIADRLQQAQSQLDELRNGTRPEQLTAQSAQVDQIDARIRAIDIALDKSVLFAPFAGKVSARMVDEGTVVGSAQSVMRLVETGQSVEARIGVPVGAAPALFRRRQQSVKVGPRTYAATVVAQLPEVDEASQTVTIVLKLADEPGLTMGATARLLANEQQAEQGYWLPSTALIAGDRGLWSLYVLVPDNSKDNSKNESNNYRVARRDVEVLYTEGERAFVRGLVETGDRIINSGTHRVVANQIVIPKGE